MINVFLGLVNLRAAAAVRRRAHRDRDRTSRSRRRDPRRKVQVDAAKLMPIAGAVLVVLLFIFVSSLFLDITHPIANPF